MGSIHETSRKNLSTVSNSELKTALSDWVSAMWAKFVYLTEALIIEKHDVSKSSLVVGKKELSICNMDQKILSLSPSKTVSLLNVRSYYCKF